MADRIDGWKAIGAYFGRDRTTVMRWAETRSLPVRRVPGGKRASVYAVRSELEAWLRAQPASSDEPPAGKAARGRRYWFAALFVAIAIAGAALLYWASRPRGFAVEERLPRDPQVTRLYLEARDEWAQRSSTSIGRAIAALEEVTRRDPGFAPAQASLADAFLLAREFGSLSDDVAFSRARAAAQRALRLDPQLHAAHRAEAFILYWSDHRPMEARAAFERALALAPRDAQTHFWYGNALADNGASRAALRELNAARLLEPGSVAIRTDFTWAQWAAGQDGVEQAFEQLRAAHPDFAVVHDCIADIRLARGDYAGFVESFSEVARLRGNASLLAQAESYRAALVRGVPALQAVMMRAALDEIAENPAQDHAWPAFLASTAQDRPQLVALLQRAAARREQWGEAGFVSRIARRWQGDGEIAALLARVRQRPME